MPSQREETCLMKQWNVVALRDALQRDVRDLETDPERPLLLCAADNAVLKVEPAEGAATFPGAPSGDAG